MNILQYLIMASKNDDLIQLEQYVKNITLLQKGHILQQL